jgi:hypothetical protein
MFSYILYRIKTIYFHSIAMWKYMWSRATKSVDDLSATIAAVHRALDITRPDDPDRPRSYILLAETLFFRFRQTRNPDDIDEAISFIRLALPNPPPPYDRDFLLSNLVNYLLDRSRVRTGSVSLEDLDEAISTSRSLVETTPRTDVYFGLTLLNLAIGLKERYEKTFCIDDINNAVAAADDAVSCTPYEHPRRATRLLTLGNCLRYRFKRLGSEEDLNQMVHIYADELLKFLPYDNRIFGSLLTISDSSQSGLNEVTSTRPIRTISKQDIALLLDCLGGALQLRFYHRGRIEDLNLAITIFQEALEFTTDGLTDPSPAQCTNNLAVALTHRFGRTLSEGDLNRAVSLTQSMTRSTPNTDIPLRALLNTFANASRVRYGWCGDRLDLENAVAAADAAITCPASDQADKSLSMNTLSVCLQTRFRATGSTEDLTRAIEVSQNALESMPSEHVERPMYLVVLSQALQHRFNIQGIFDDIDQALNLKQQAIDLMHESFWEQAAYINDFGNILQTKFEHTGNIEELNRAVDMKNDALIRASRGDMQQNRFVFLISLGSVLYRRFTCTGSSEDLDGTITLTEQAAELVPLSHPDRPVVLNNLCIALLGRLRRKSSPGDLARGKTACARAIQATPIGHPAWPSVRISYGILASIQYDSTNLMEHLNEAVKAFEDARPSSKEIPERLTDLDNLAESLRIRFGRTKVLDDITRAVAMREELILSTPQEHIDRARFLWGLAVTLCERFEETHSLADLDRAVSICEEACSLFSSPPAPRLQAAVLAANILETPERRDSPRAAQFLKKAIEILPAITARTLSSIDQQYALESHGAGSISSRLAALLVETGHSAFEALELLERGRGIIASLQIETRTDISVLEEQHPELAVTFRQLRDELDRPFHYLNYRNVYKPNEPEESSQAITQARRRHTALDKFNKILGEIRGVDGFERFLLGPSEKEMNLLAQRGPIVVFNVAPSRSDAFLITSTDISILRLPALEPSVLMEKIAVMNNALNDSNDLFQYHDAQNDMKHILKWLWDVAVHPVLTRLALTQETKNCQDWPHVKWVTGGLLSCFPIHAAGDEFANALDLVVSSYTMTVKSLIYAQEKAHKGLDLSDVKEKALFVAMPTTPGHDDLPFVAEELEAFTSTNLVPKEFERIYLQATTKAEVLSNLPECVLAHFACHGISDASDPSQSRLLLQDWKNDPLSVADISALHLENAKLAYLSACHVASNKVMNLLDEHIHIVGAFQLAGFPRVIGTLWQVDDRRSVDIAREVYRVMSNSTGMRIDTVAEALHSAVQKLKSATMDNSDIGFTMKVADDPFIWAPYVYFGI